MQSRNALKKLGLVLLAAGLGVGLLAVLMVTSSGVSQAAGQAATNLLVTGLAAPAGTSTIGDYVWFDQNVDGEWIGEAGETQYTGGVNGVLVKLYRDANQDGIPDPSEQISFTVTGDAPDPGVQTGWYKFTFDKTANQYLVQIDPSNFAPGGPLEGYVHTSIGVYGTYQNVIVVTSAETIINRSNVDFGYAKSGAQITKTLMTPESGSATVNDTVIYSITITNSGQLDLITVPLYDYYGPACLAYLDASIPPSSVDGALGVIRWNDVGPLAAGASTEVTVSFKAQKSNEMYWKEGGWPDYAPKGMPDFSQKQDKWDNPPGSGQKWYACGPVATANSLWWFDSKFETGTAPPPAISDSYPLVTNFGNNWDDHDPRNVVNLTNALAGLMGTTPAAGTNVNALAAGLAQYITNTVGSNQYTVKVVAKPTFNWVADEVRRSEDVILLLGFWQLPSLTADPTLAHRVGGHYVTVAGANILTPTVAFSDPYLDRAESGGAGRVLPAPHATLHPSPGPISDSVHNDAQYLSQDVYTATLTLTPGGVWGPENYVEPVPFFGCPQIANYQGQNVPTEFLNMQVLCNPAPQAGFIYSEVEYAVAVSPVTASVMCGPTVNIAVVSGAVDQLDYVRPTIQDEEPVTIEIPTALAQTAFSATAAGAVSQRLALALGGASVILAGFGIGLRRMRAR